MTASVYILLCADGSYYTGVTRDGLDRRLAQHNAGEFKGYTYKRRPVQLAWSEEFERLTDAIAAERQIKGWSRAKKQALIAGDFDRLRTLSRRGLRPSFETRPGGRSSG